MWQTIAGWFGAVFNFLRPQRADFEKLTQMHTDLSTTLQQRIDSLCTEIRANKVDAAAELQKYKDLANKELEEYKARSDTRIETLEHSEQQCRSSLAKATSQLVNLRERVKGLMLEREERERAVAIKETPGFQERTKQQVTELIKEEEKQTRVEEGGK